MHERMLKRIREKVRTGKYVMTLHAEEEMDNDELTILDIERCLLKGEIIQRQKDRTTGEWKYLVRGKDYTGSGVVTVVKLGVSGYLVMITVYAE